MIDNATGLNLGGSVEGMLAEARGYHLSFVLAHQNLGQLPVEVREGLSANARNKVYFTCSPEDACQLARHTLPELDESDLARLGPYTAAARLVSGNRQMRAFTLTTSPMPQPHPQARQRLREHVRATGPTPSSDDPSSDEPSPHQPSFGNGLPDRQNPGLARRAGWPRHPRGAGRNPAGTPPLAPPPRFHVRTGGRPQLRASASLHLREGRGGECQTGCALTVR